MLTKEECQEVKIKLIKIGEKQNFLARKLKITPQKLSNILNGKLESRGNEAKIREWLGKE